MPNSTKDMRLTVRKIYSLFGALSFGKKKTEEAAPPAVPAKDTEVSEVSEEEACVSSRVM